MRGCTVYYDRDRSSREREEDLGLLFSGERRKRPRKKSPRKIFRRGDLILLNCVVRLRQAERISCSRISVNQVTMRHTHQASARRFSDFQYARHPRVVNHSSRGRTFDLRARPSSAFLAARGCCCARLEGRQPRIRAYSAPRKQPIYLQTHRSRDLEACVACSSLPPSLAPSLFLVSPISLQGTETRTE